MYILYIYLQNQRKNIINEKDKYMLNKLKLN